MVSVTASGAVPVVPRSLLASINSANPVAHVCRQSSSQRQHLDFYGPSCVPSPKKRLGRAMRMLERQSAYDRLTASASVLVYSEMMSKKKANGAWTT